MSGYEVVIQWSEDDPPLLYQTLRTWAEARDLLAYRLRRFADDSCPVCRADAGLALDELDRTPAGSDFCAAVEGDEYLIREAQ